MTEDKLQAAIAAHLTARASSDVLWWHTPNGGSRNAIEAAKLRRMGVKPGIPDLLLLVGGRLHALELKTAKQGSRAKGRLSAHQMIVLDAMGRQGVRVAVAYGLDEALAQIEAWGLFRSTMKRAA